MMCVVFEKYANGRGIIVLVLAIFYRPHKGQQKDQRDQKTKTHQDIDGTHILICFKVRSAYAYFLSERISAFLYMTKLEAQVPFAHDGCKGQD